MNVRSRVHEYRRRRLPCRSGVAFVVTFADQRVYRLAPGQQTQPLTRGRVVLRDFALDPAKAVDLRSRGSHRAW